MLTGVIILYCLGAGGYGIAGYIFGWTLGNTALLIVKALIWPISLVLKFVSWILKKLFGFVFQPLTEYREDRRDYKAYNYEQHRQEVFNKRADRWDKHNGINNK